MLASLLLTLSIACGESVDPPRPQIAWQADLDAAVAAAKANGRPLLLAFNMDAESASERIVREQYRDPTFVEHANRCFAVMGSVFRHNPRDYDESGRRIACPRLGSVTCGEHIALEPKLYELLEGDRISPRHAFIDVDGTTRFDLSLLFDLRELEVALADAVKSVHQSPAPVKHGATPVDTWRQLFFTTIKKQSPNRKHVLTTLGDNARRLGIGETAGEIVRSAVMDTPRLPVGMATAPIEGMLELLAQVDGKHEMTRFLLLSHRAFNVTGAKEALAIAYAPSEVEAIEKAIANVGGTIDVGVLLAYARAFRLGGKLSPKVAPPRGSVEELEARIHAAVTALESNPNDPASALELGRSSLECARAKIDAGGGDGIDLHLGDADQFLRRAKEQMPDDLTIDLDLVKVAYLKSDFERQEAMILEVAKKLPALPDLFHSEQSALERALLEPEIRHDVLRWVGDAAARMIDRRYGKDPAAQIDGIIRGATALLLAAASPRSDAVDWQSATSFFDVLGQRGTAWLIAEEGAQRLPASSEIRAAARRLAWKLSRPELGVEFSQREFARKPDFADHSWYLGVDLLQLAEWRRRMERPDEAILEYQRAISAFRRCGELRPDYAASTRRQSALAHQGIGFAHLLAQRQSEAGEQLVAIAQTDPTIVDVRDGLDRETVDLIDNALEYRIGRRSPVDALALLDRILAAHPQAAFFASSIADAMLREGLRADGRSDVAEGDRCMLAAIACAERGVAADPEDETAKITAAQCLTVEGERLLFRDDLAGAASKFSAAAPHLGLAPLPENADRATIDALASDLRTALGEARPRFRPGR